MPPCHVPVPIVPTVTIEADPAIAENVDDNEVPPTVGIFVLSISVNHPFVTLAPVAANEPVIVILLAPTVISPVTFADPLKFCPHIVLVVVSVAALPEVFWLRVGNVQLVSVPDDGVPNAPLKVTNAPAEPTFTASAVATPVPSPVIEPTAGVIVVFPAAVINPLPLTVNVPACVAEPNEPTLAFTVASVKAVEPVASPV